MKLRIELKNARILALPEEGEATIVEVQSGQGMSLSLRRMIEKTLFEERETCKLCNGTGSVYDMSYGEMIPCPLCNGIWGD